MDGAVTFVLLALACMIPAALLWAAGYIALRRSRHARWAFLVIATSAAALWIFPWALLILPLAIPIWILTFFLFEWAALQDSK